MSRDALLFPALAHESSYHIEQGMIYAHVKKSDLVASIAQHIPPEITFGEITPEIIERYQVARITAADNSTVNLEMGLIVTAIKSAGMWDGPLQDMYREYIPPSVFLNIAPREGYVPPPPEVIERNRLWRLHTLRKTTRTFLAAAVCNPKLRVGYLHAQFTIGTGIAFEATRFIRLSDIDRDALTVRVRGYHVVPERTVTICGNDGILALDELVKRSRGFGALDEDFLFPFKRDSRGWIPKRPMTHHTLLNQYHLINKEAGIPNHAPIRPTEDLCALYGTQPLNEIEPELPPAPEIQPAHSSPAAGKLYDIAKDVNAKIGDGMMSVKGLIEKLKKAGLSPEAILGILSDEGE